MSNDDAHSDFRPSTIEEELQLRRHHSEWAAVAHRDVITARLALALIAVMGITVLGHYVTVGILTAQGNTQAVEGLHNVFNAWLPVISGLASAGVTYYFTNSSRK